MDTTTNKNIFNNFHIIKEVNRSTENISAVITFAVLAIAAHAYCT
jgi:hypothetical protein